MLEIIKVEKANRQYLGGRKFNPLSSVFNVTAKCIAPEKIDGEVMGSDYTQSIETGKIYNFLIENMNLLREPSLVKGDAISLKDLENKKHIRVLNSDTSIHWHKNSF